MYKKRTERAISCSGQLEPTWRGPVAGGGLIYSAYCAPALPMALLFGVARGPFTARGHTTQRGTLTPLCTCVFFCWLLVLWGASRSARKKASCARPHWRKLRVWGLAAGRLFFRFFSLRVLRFIMLGGCWGQKHGFRPRRTGRAPEWSPKREMPVLASRALATDPFPRFFQARPARKLRLTDPKCSSAATQISPTRLKPPKIAVFVTISPQRVFSRDPSHRSVVLDPKHRLRANIGCETWLVPNIASRPKGTFLALKRAHMGTTAYVLAR